MNILIVWMLIATAAAAPLFTPDPKYDTRWEKFKVTFGKQYKDASEEAMRREIWEKNVTDIDNHNAEYEQGKQTYKQGETFFADMTEEEKNEYLSKPKTS